MVRKIMKSSVRHVGQCIVCASMLFDYLVLIPNCQIYSYLMQLYIIVIYTPTESCGQ